MNINPNYSVFQSVITAFATVAPMLLVCFAFGATPNSIERAQIVVQGCEQIVAILATALVLSASYLFGFKKGVIAMNGAVDSVSTTSVA